LWWNRDGDLGRARPANDSDDTERGGVRRIIAAVTARVFLDELRSELAPVEAAIRVWGA
jgi:hypothetical protein